MGPGRQWKTRAAVMAALAIAAPALAQPAEPDGPVPTARYERPPVGVDPSILNRPPPEPRPEPERTPSAPSASAGAAPNIALPEAMVLRRHGFDAPDSLETTTAAPIERPWERQAVGARPSPPEPAAPAPEIRTASAPAQAPTPAPEPRPVRAAPVGRMVELQIGAFADRGNAERAARTARAVGPTRIQPTTVGGVTYHRVIVGPGGEASMRAALSRLGFPDARIPRGS